MKEIYINENLFWILYLFIILIIYIIIVIYDSIYYKNKTIFIIDNYGHVHKIKNIKIKKNL